MPNGTSRTFALVVCAAIGCGDSRMPTPPIDPARTPPTSPYAPVTPQQPFGPTPAPIAPPTSTPVPVAPAGSGIVVARADGSDAHIVVDGSWPAWSPDGRRLAFEANGWIHVIDVDGTHDVRLALGETPAWSPDGRWIAFRSQAGIDVMRADGTEAHTLVRHGFRTDTYAPWDNGVAKPTWSPDGTRIAFEHLGDGDTQPAHIFVMGADGSDVHALTQPTNGFNCAESDPAWSPNGARLAFWSYCLGIAVVGRDGGGQQTVYMSFPTFAYGAKPAWRPSGDSLAFTGHWPTGYQVWISSANGGQPSPMLLDGYSLSWSPDGTRVAYVTARAR